MHDTTRFIGHAAALACALLATACSTPGPDGMSPSLVRAADVSGDAAAAAGQEDAAAGLYERAYRASPSPAVAIKWGRALRAAGSAQVAVVDLQEAATRFPGSAELLTELGRCAAAGAYRQEAADAFARAEAVPGAGWDTFMAAGAFEAVTGQASLASAAFGRAEAAAGDSRERYAARANLALLRAQGGDLRGGISDMAEIASHPGVDSRVHADLALLYGLDGNRAASAEQLRQAGLPPQEEARLGAWLGGQGPGPVARVSRIRRSRSSANPG